MNYSISSRENGKTKKTQTNKVKEMVVVTMTSGANTILNDNRRSQLTALKKEEKIKFQSF
jgi:hypothetical protein